MEALKSRLASYKKGKRIKNTLIKWPHPDNYRANPTTLAEAGFYFVPSLEDRDNVRCFMCEKELGDWEEDDDPFDLHWAKCKDKCAWAVVRCGLKYDYADDQSTYDFSKAREPRGKPMERARLQTFIAQDWWPHDANPSHGASSTKMAQAGFIYTPSKPSDDTATCLYCNISLSGWTKSDDPLKEHERRMREAKKTCPFFPKPPSPPPEKATVTRKTSQRAASKSKSRSTIATKHSDDEDETATSKPNPLKRSTRRAESVKGKGKAPVEDIEDGDEGANDDDEEEAPPPPPPKKPTRSVSKSNLKASGGVAKTTRSSTRSTKTPIAAESDSDGAPIAKTHTRSKSKSKSKSSKTPVMVESDAEDDDSQPKKKRLTRSKSKAPTSASVNEDSDVEPEAETPLPPKKPAKPTRKTASKPKDTPKLTTDEESESHREDEDVDMTAETPKPKKPGRPPKVTALACSRSTVVDSEDGEVDIPPIVPAPKTKKTSKSSTSSKQGKGSKKSVVQSEDDEDEERDRFATPEAETQPYADDLDAQGSGSDIFNTPPEGLKSKPQSIDPLELGPPPPLSLVPASKTRKGMRSTSSSKSKKAAKKKQEEAEAETDDLDMDTDVGMKEEPQVEAQRPRSPSPPPPPPKKESKSQSKASSSSDTKAKSSKARQDNVEAATHKLSRTESKMSIVEDSEDAISVSLTQTTEPDAASSFQVTSTSSRSKESRVLSKAHLSSTELHGDSDDTTVKLTRIRSQISTAEDSEDAASILPTPATETDGVLSSRATPVPSTSAVSNPPSSEQSSSSQPPPSLPNSSSEPSSNKTKEEKEGDGKVKKAKDRKIKKLPTKTVKRSVSLKPLGLGKPKGKVIDLSTDDDDDTPTTKAKSKPDSSSQKPIPSASATDNEREKAQQLLPPVATSSTKNLEIPPTSTRLEDATPTDDVDMDDIQSQLQPTPVTPTNQSIRLPAFVGGAATSPQPQSLPPTEAAPEPEEPWKVPLTEEELDITVEEWLKKQYAAQLEAYRLEGEKQQMEFVERAKIVRKRIEELPVA